MGLMKSAAKRPGWSVCVITFLSTSLLPFVTVVALTPLIVASYIEDYLKSNGFGSVVYLTCVQGFMLIAIVIILFSASFVFAILVNILHSKYFSRENTKKLHVISI